MRKSRFPKGWNEEELQKLIALYENQTEEEAVAEDDPAFGDPNSIVIEVSQNGVSDSLDDGETLVDQKIPEQTS